MKKSFFCLVLMTIFITSFSSCELLLSILRNTGDELDALLLEPDFNVDREVLACYKLVNKFRIGKEAFYWNKDNKTTTSKVGKLDQLVLDEELCKLAKIRAEEAVRVWDHTRPDGTPWYTVFDNKYQAAGENIAAGNSSGTVTFEQWKEDNCEFNGQGHRRNMLSEEAKKIGIAYVYAPGTKYTYYWAMELARY